MYFSTNSSGWPHLPPSMIYSTPPETLVLYGFVVDLFILASFIGAIECWGTFTPRLWNDDGLFEHHNTTWCLSRRDPHGRCLLGSPAFFSRFSFARSFFEVANRGFHKWGYPKLDGLHWTILLRWMIWGYPIFRNPPNSINGLNGKVYQLVWDLL